MRDPADRAARPGNQRHPYGHRVTRGLHDFELSQQLGPAATWVVQVYDRQIPGKFDDEVLLEIESVEWPHSLEQDEVLDPTGSGRGLDGPTGTGVTDPDDREGYIRDVLERRGESRRPMRVDDLAGVV